MMQGKVAAIVLTALLAGGGEVARAQTEVRAPIYTPEEMLLEWPLAAENARYRTLREETIREVTEKLAEISLAARDRDQLQYWGRIIGTPAHDEATTWIAEKFRSLGIRGVESVRLDVPTQRWPDRWSARVWQGKKSIEMSALSVIGHGRGRVVSGFDLTRFQLEYVGLGTEADFRGRDVMGKAVMIYSQPNPSMYQSTAMNKFGAIARAEKHGAAIVLMAVGLPGNMVGQATLPPGSIPTFMIGAEDFASIRESLETSDIPLALEASLKMKIAENAKTSLVYAMLPGTSDENIILSAHIDGYYEAAYDNGAGVGALVALAEYFASVPREQRRRNIYFVVNPGHHVPQRLGTQWIARNWPDKLKKTALISNLEHLPYIQAIAFPDGWRMGTSPSAIMSTYAGGSDAFRRLTIDSMRSFGVATQTVERERMIAAAKPEIDPFGVTTYRGMVGGDLRDLGHFAPFFQALSADWPYHSIADTPSVIHWPAATAYARGQARIIDAVNEFSIAELSGGGHPIAR